MKNREEYYKDYREFLSYEPNMRIRFLLLDRELVNKIRKYPSFHIIERIIRDDYQIKLVDIKTHLEARELYEALSMFMADIKCCDIDSSLIEIYKKLEFNRDIVKGNFLDSVGNIMDNMSDPISNDSFLEGALDVLDKGNSTNMYIGPSVFLDGDKRPESDSLESFSHETFQINFYIRYIKRVLHYLSLPEEDRKKYFNEKFLESCSDSLIKEIKGIKKEDLRVAYQHRNFISSKLFPQFSSEMNEFLRNVCFATSTDKEHARSRHFSGPSYGGVISSMPYSYRIYIHTSPDSASRKLFLREYILRCIDAGINYDIKGSGSSDADYLNSKDSTVIYIEKSEDVPRVISILNSIGEEHPEWINNFGSPLWNCSQLHDSYYSFGHGGAVSVNEYHDEFGRLQIGHHKTYNEVFDDYLKEAYKLLLKEENGRRLPHDARIKLFRRLLYQVKNSYQRNEARRIQKLTEKGDEYSQAIQGVNDAFKERKKIKMRRNGSCDAVTDCFMAYEKEEIDYLDELYSNRCRSNRMVDSYKNGVVY